MKFKFACASALMSVCSLCASVSYAAACNITETTRTLTSNEDHTLDGGTLIIPAGVTVNLNGFNLTYRKIGGFSGTGTITSKDNLGTLTLDVAEGVRVENGGGDTVQVKIDGQLHLVKTGKGTLSISGSKFAMHTYSGGTDVQEGILTTTKYGKTNSSGAFGSPALVTVSEGAKFDSHGVASFASTDIFTLDGGTYDSSYSQSTANQSQSLVVTKNSKVLYTKTILFAGSVEIAEGFVLIFESSGSDASWTWKPSSIEGGTVYLNSGKFSLGKDVGMPTEGVPTASLELGPNAVMDGNYIYSVNDLSFANGASVTGPIHVYGTYEPVADNIYMPVMQNGSTLDLSGLTAPLSAQAAKFGAGKIKVDLSGRTLQENEMIVEWDAMPEGTEFEFVGSDKEFAVSEAGIVCDAATDQIVSSVWTGAAGDGNVMNPANWIFKDSLGKVLEISAEKLREVAATLEVTFSGDISKISFASPLPFAVATFDDAFLGADATWNALANVPNDLVLDLKGHKLTLPKLTTTTCTATITDSVGDGVVEMEVEDGVSFNNETLNFTGKVKIVKKGLGTFVAVKDETNDGGFEVAEGKLTPASEKLNFTALTPFGKGAITLDEGAILDPLGGYNWSAQVINLNGGIITNTVAQSGLSSSAVTANLQFYFNPTINLLKESIIAIGEDYNFQGIIESTSDCELKVSIALGKYFTWYPTKVQNLKLNVISGGWFRTPKKPITSGQQTNLVFTCNAAICMNHTTQGDGNTGGMDVLDYNSLYTSNYNYGNAKLNVYGTFRTAGKYFHGCQMMDGSTIVTPETDYLNIQSSSSAEGSKLLTFADNATITIDCSERKQLRTGARVVGWADSTRPANIATLHFRADENTITQGYKVEVMDDGIHLKSQVAYDIDVSDSEVQKLINDFFKDEKNFDTDIKTINTWLNKDAKNGYTLKDSIILGLPVVEKETCAAPYLVNDVVQSVEGENVALKFGGINPIFGKADIVYTIESATAPDAMEWNSAAKGPLTDKDMRVSVSLPQPSEGESMVRYYRVKFSVSEKASEVQ